MRAKYSDTPFFACQTHHWHTSTHRHEENPGASEATLEKEYQRFKQMFELTPDRLKTIVKNFVGVLRKGLEEPGQTVVSNETQCYACTSRLK